MSRRARSASARVIGVEYHERQILDHCCLHALNNVIGAHRYTAADMTAADARHRVGGWSDATCETLLAESDEFASLAYPAEPPTFEAFRAIWPPRTEPLTALGTLSNVFLVVMSFWMVIK